MDQTRDYAMQLATGEEPMHDENVETTYEQVEREKKPIVEAMMGENYKKFFRTEEENDQESYTEEDFAQDEIQANYETDAKMI